MLHLIPNHRTNLFKKSANLSLTSQLHRKLQVIQLDLVFFFFFVVGMQNDGFLDFIVQMQWWLSRYFVGVQ